MNGMADNEDEHDFSDDDLDTLPVNALYELEQNAIQSTQPAPVQNASRAPPKQQILPGNSRFPISHSAQPTHYNAESRPWPQQAQQQQPQYGYANEEMYADQSFEDENVATPVEEKESFIPDRIPGEMTQRENWRQERFSKPAGRPNPINRNTTRPPVARNQPPQAQQGAVNTGMTFDASAHDPMLLDWQPPQPGFAQSIQQQELQAQIEDLLRERDQLATELKASSSTILTQKGEISIIREKMVKESTTFGRQLTALKKAADEEAAKHKAHLEHMLSESRKLAEANQFLKHDLDVEVDRSTTFQRRVKEKPPQEKDDRPDTTPNRATAHSLRDGFEDTELMIISPSRSGRRSKGGTPTGGNKRKRKMDVQSPIPFPALALRQSSGPAAPIEEAKTESGPENREPTVRRDHTAEKNLRFVQRILNHRIAGEKERIVEIFMKFSFPSDPSKTFTSIILDATSRPAGKRLTADILQVFIDLWSRSLKEKYFVCIASLIDVVNFIIDLDISVLDITTIQNLLPVLQSSGEINGTIRFKNAPLSNQNVAKSKQSPKVNLCKEVDGTACLDLLYNIACICVDDEKRIDRFWRSMNMDFVLLMLNSSQPIVDITFMLNLLSTSILRETFGMISSSAEEQSKMETWILDRVCYLLWERPRVEEVEAAPSKSDICKLRLEAMGLLSRLALASAPHPHRSADHHGSILVARHRSAIARLIRCIYDETDAMYLHSPSHALHAELVNNGIRLLYHLLQNHGEAINMQQKLLAINGGVHKHRVVLTRLAFSEGLFLDAGITQRTVDMATDMLEEAVTPEEAESLVEAFPGYKGRRGTQS